MSSKPSGPLRNVDAIYSANTLHIMGWREVEAMFRGVDAVLSPQGIVCVYGPFRYDGAYTSESNRDLIACSRNEIPCPVSAT